MTLASTRKGTVRNAVLPGRRQWLGPYRPEQSGCRHRQVEANESPARATCLGQPINFGGSIQFAKAEEQARFTGDWRLTPDVRRSLGLRQVRLFGGA